MEVHYSILDKLIAYLRKAFGEFRAWDRRVSNRIFPHLFPLLKPYILPELVVITREIKDNEVIVPEVFFVQPPLDIRDHLVLYQWRWWWSEKIDIPKDIDRLIP